MHVVQTLRTKDQEFLGQSRLHSNNFSQEVIVLKMMMMIDDDGDDTDDGTTRRKFLFLAI